MVIKVWNTRSLIHPHSRFPCAFLSAGRPQWHIQVQLSPELPPNWPFARLLARQRRRQRGNPQSSKHDSLEGTRRLPRHEYPRHRRARRSVLLRRDGAEAVPNGASSVVP